MSRTEFETPKLTFFQRTCFCATYIALSAAGLWYLRLCDISKHAAQYFEEMSKEGDWKFPGTEVVLRRTYTGVGPIDTLLSFLVAAFLPLTSGWTPGSLLQLVYFFVELTAIIAVWSIESARQRNSGALITFTSIWALFYQTVGGAVIMPLYYVLYTFTSARASYWEQRRNIPLAKAATLLPALILGYVCPTLAFAYPSESIETTQTTTALWQVCPILVNIIWVFLSFFGGSPKHGGQSGANKDRPHLFAVYTVSFVVCFVGHLVMLYICFTSNDPTLSLSFVFVPNPPSPLTLGGAMLFFFKVDFILIFAASLIWCFQVELELIQSGLVSFGALSAMVATALGSICFGPGAVICAVFGWRESRIDAIDPDYKLR